MDSENIKKILWFKLCSSGIEKAHVHHLWKGVQLQTPAERAHMERAWGRTAHKVVRSYLPSKITFTRVFFFQKLNDICSHIGFPATGRVATTRQSTNRHYTPMSWRGTMEWKESTDKRWVLINIWFLISYLSGCVQTSWMSHLSQEIEEMVLSPVPQEDLFKWECNLPMWNLWKGGLHQCSDPSEPRANQAQRWQTFHMRVLPEQVCYCDVSEWTQEQETWGELKGRGCPKEDVPLWPLWKAADKQDETSGSHWGHPRGQTGL